MQKIFLKYKPDIIFHAGALKHVTICEENVSEAVRTNVIATSMLANLAENILVNVLSLSLRIRQ